MQLIFAMSENCQAAVVKMVWQQSCPFHTRLRSQLAVPGLHSVPTRSNGAYAPLWAVMCKENMGSVCLSPHWPHRGDGHRGSRTVLTTKCAWVNKAAPLQSAGLAPVLLPHLPIVSPTPGWTLWSSTSTRPPTIAEHAYAFKAVTQHHSHSSCL